jgi:hypothetical protein
MTSLQTTTTLLGLGMGVFILVLLSRDHLYLRHGLFWMVVAFGGVVLGIWPGIIDHAAIWLGIGYSPAGLLMGALLVLLVKYLYADMIQTRLERQLRRLNQRLAMFELNQTPNTLKTAKATDKPNNSV